LVDKWWIAMKRLSDILFEQLEEYNYVRGLEAEIIAFYSSPFAQARKKGSKWVEIADLQGVAGQVG
jgi:hypothetical protein